jgi:hypothetical protein
MFLFKISVMYILFEYEKETRPQFAAWAEEENVTFNNTRFSDEIFICIGPLINKTYASVQDNIDTTVMKKN